MPNCITCGKPTPKSRKTCNSACLSKHISIRNSGGRRQYTPTPEIDAIIQEVYQSESYRIKAVKVAAQRTGWARYAITRRAAELGVGQSYQTSKDWTPKELDILDQYSYLTLHALKDKLLRECGTKRTTGSIGCKIWRMKLREVENRDWYTPLQLSKLLGVHHQKTIEFISKGKLRAQKRKGIKMEYAITYSAVQEFVSRHSKEINLCKVNRRWFLLLVSNGKIIED